MRIAFPNGDGAATVGMVRVRGIDVARDRQDVAKGDFARNLRAACDARRSISDVCRDLGINRQQFNKYLSGASYPSAHNLRRICGYFDADLTQPPTVHGDQQPSAGTRTSRQALFDPTVQAMQQAFPEGSRKLDRYLGFYFSYYLSPAYPGMVLKSISRFYKQDGLCFDKTMERALRRDGAPSRPIVNRYVGSVIHTDDRIYVLHQHTTLHQTLSMVAFYPSFAATLQLLSGVFVSVSSGPARQPFAARAVYEYKGRSPDLRAMIRNSGLFAIDSEQIAPEIAARLDNHLDVDETVLTARTY
jgi:transcriptional regulator with XRE-family HTH domain